VWRCPSSRTTLPPPPTLGTKFQAPVGLILAGTLRPPAGLKEGCGVGVTVSSPFYERAAHKPPT